ncbi:hypothetical protein PPS11_03775 [Pseudomonas putida S11]|nr:hypothetical protein PPS11_03775 [Pseudomonas putida S11]
MHLVVAGDVGRDCYGIGTAVGAFIQYLEQRLFIARSEHQASTLAGKCVRGGPADTAGSASDHHDFAAQWPSALNAPAGRFLFCARFLVVVKWRDRFAGLDPRKLKSGAIDQGQPQPFNRASLTVRKHGFTLGIHAVVDEARAFDPPHGGQKLRAEIILPVLKEARELMSPLHVFHAIAFTWFHTCRLIDHFANPCSWTSEMPAFAVLVRSRPGALDAVRASHAPDTKALVGTCPAGASLRVGYAGEARADGKVQTNKSGGTKRCFAASVCHWMMS